jgi:hypothetical protein
VIGLIWNEIIGGRMKKIILDLCGGTGAWSKPYKDAGYDVRNITLPNYDVRTYQPPKNVYGILAAPPCPMFSFCRTNAKKPRDLKGAMKIVKSCLKIIWACQYRIQKDTQKFSPLKFWALENPARGMLTWFLGKPAFCFQPYEFGDNHKKHTALWGCFNLPQKNPIICTKPKFDKLFTKEIYPEFYGKLSRTERRAITPPNFAKAFFEANK